MQDQNKDQDFPGYPHYPASEDITREGNNTGKEQIEDEKDGVLDGAQIAQISDNDADVTAEDLDILNAAENGSTEDDASLIESGLDDVDEDGEPLNENSSDLSGSDLDVPGSEDDDADELLGEEDEENNSYSLGGDNHESQEENQGE